MLYAMISYTEQKLLWSHGYTDLLSKKLSMMVAGENFDKNKADASYGRSPRASAATTTARSREGAD